MKRLSNFRYIGGKVYFHHVKDGISYTDPFIPMWSEWKNLNQNSIGTIYAQAAYIFKFWIYALYFPANENESFRMYLARYKKVITESGFKIEERLHSSSLNFKQTIYEAKKTNSVTNDLVALESFFKIIFESEVLLDSKNLPDIPRSDFYLNKLEMKTLEAKDRHSKGYAYGLKAKGLMRLSIATRTTVLSGLIKKRVNASKRKTTIGLENTKAMPLEVFNSLLAVAPPQRKLLYLLCATSPRIGQSLHLTWFDVDLEQKRVFLINPASINKQLPVDARGYLFLEQPSRKELLKEKKININTRPHSLIRWKTGEIPSIEDNEGYLFFAFDEWREMFFETYIRVRNSVSSVDRQKNPFVFQTSSGKRLLPSEASDGLKTDLDAVRARYPEFENLQIKGGFHLFRHMFGTLMASAAYLAMIEDERLGAIDTGGGVRKNIVEAAQIVTANKMGHAPGSDSIKQYFSPDSYILEYTMKLLQGNVDGVRNIKKHIIETVCAESAE